MSRRGTRMQSTQQLLGVREIRDSRIVTEDGSLAFFILQPDNLSVLPEAGIRARIRQLTNLLGAVDHVELLAMNSRESFARNRAYYLKRAQQEPEPAIRALLQKDRAHLDSIQMHMTLAREFCLLIRMREEKEEAAEALLRHLEESFRDSGFVIRLAGREDLKRILAVYVEQNVTNDRLDDYDGQRYEETEGEYGALE